MNDLQFSLEKRLYDERINLFGFSTGENRRWYYLKPVEVEDVQRDFAEVIQPFLSIHPAEVQRLMDTLWTEGIRPSHKVEEASQIEAVKYHLEDMRKLVFRTKR